MTTLAQQQPALPPTSTKLDQELILLSNMAGREVVPGRDQFDHTVRLWRDHPYFTTRTLAADRQAEAPSRYQLEVGSFVTDALISLKHTGYEVGPEQTKRLHSALAASPDAAPLVRLAQDVAALGKFLKAGSFRAEQRPRYEAALEVRSAQLAHLCHYTHRDPAQQLASLQAAGDRLTGVGEHQTHSR